MFHYLSPDTKGFVLSVPLSFFTYYSNVYNLENGIAEPTSEIVGVKNEINLEKSQGISPLIAPLSSPTLFAEWEFFQRINVSVPKIVYITGKITPNQWYLSGTDGFEIYQERELYGEKPDGTVELTASYHDSAHGGGITLAPAIWDNGIIQGFGNYTYNSGLIPVSTSSLPHTYEYYCGIGASGKYEVWFHDTVNGNWYYYRYDDSTNPSTYYNEIHGSSELWQFNTPAGLYMANTYPVIDEWNWVNNNWYLPKDIWTYIGWSGNRPYVHIDYNWGGYQQKQLITYSYCDSRWTT